MWIIKHREIERLRANVLPINFVQRVHCYAAIFLLAVFAQALRVGSYISIWGRTVVPRQLRDSHDAIVKLTGDWVMVAQKKITR